jgi:phosphopantothenoylcysteine decarboxylase / phosphopantothenate---cysteine ligase
MARLLLGVSGGIAAYKALELARLATSSGHAVRVVRTESAERFVGDASFEGITGAPVLHDQWARDPARGVFPDQSPPDHDPISHLEVVSNADVLLVAPATANVVAKLAAGLADDLLTTAALAARCPVVVAPAMNNHMYEHPATQANVELLRSRGVTVIEPGEGALASRGEHGRGRLPEPAELLAVVESLAGGGGPMDGLRVLVSAGGTREPIDSVRFVGNRSSGRMGFAIAEEAARRGAAVTVVAANVSLDRRAGIEYVDVETAAQLRDACVRAFEDCDVLVMAAAVADYRPAGGAAETKLKKETAETLSLELERTDDVLVELGSRRRGDQTLVGFAAEHGADAVAIGRDKLARKGLDLLVVNDISRSDIGFEVDANEVTIVSRTRDEAIPRAAKSEVAAKVLDAVAAVRAEQPAGA